MSLTQKDLDTLNNIDNIFNYSQYIQEYNKLESGIQSKTLGTNGDETIKCKLIDLETKVRNKRIPPDKSDDFSFKWNLLKRLKGLFRNNFNLDTIAAAKKQII